MVGHPLFTTEPLSWEAPPGGFDALLLGSAAAIRHGGPALARYAGLPVFAVGEATAAAAREAGFTVERTGVGGLQALLDADAGVPRHYLRLGGEERVTLSPHRGQAITERTVYRLGTVPLSPDFVRDLSERHPLVALHSAAAARHLAAEIDRKGIARGHLSLIAIGPRVAKPARFGWAALHLADRPHDAALLAKAATLCK